MNRMRGFGLLVFVPAALWVLAGSTDSLAQGSGQDKDKSKKDKKKNERMAEKEKAGSEHTGKIKYKPRRMNDNDMTEWTDGNPPGWQRGGKTGWRGADVPPGQLKGHEKETALAHPAGWDTWGAKRQGEWNSKLDRSRDRIIERIRSREDLSLEDEQSAIISLDEAVRKGVPLKHVEATMSKVITRGARGRDLETITRAMAYGADKDTDYNRLDRSIDNNVNAGVTGDDLALSIYKAIDDQHPAPSKEAVKKPWWKRIFGR